MLMKKRFRVRSAFSSLQASLVAHSDDRNVENQHHLPSSKNNQPSSVFDIKILNSAHIVNMLLLCKLTKEIQESLKVKRYPCSKGKFNAVCFWDHLSSELNSCT